MRYRRLEHAERRKPSPRPGQPFEVGVGSSIVLDASSIHSVRSHWVDYGHGIEELGAFRRLAPDHHLLLDIGAAEGIYAAAFCALTGRRACAFEPSPEMFGRLERICHINPTLSIAPFKLALGAGVGQRSVQQYTDGQFSGVGAPATGHTMAVSTLDIFLDSHDLAPDFAKIDVEGMEFEVLRGGERAFRGPIRTIVLEVHYHALAQLGETTAGLQRLLEDYGFALEDLAGVEISDLDAFSRARPERIPGYTVVVARKVTDQVI
jgi:FkbM family methyltransferase